LDDYDLILKIHTKNDKDGVDTLINKWYVKRKLWFELLIDALIGNKKIFMKNLHAFEKDKTLGMVGSKYCITSNIKNFNLVEEGIHQVMKHLGLNNYMPIKFVAGTMFMVRSSIMKSIKGVYTIEDFMPTNGAVKDGTLAHIMERVFGCMVTAAGYKIKGFDKSRSFETYSLSKKICRFFYQKKVTKSNYLQVKILKIPVYHRKYKGQI
jgi:rhamnosyltransferase